MTFWLDAQLPPDLAAWLGTRYRIVAKPLREIGLRDAEDDILMAAAKRFDSIVLITKDADFVELARTVGTPPQIIWLRCGNLSNMELQLWLSSRFEEALQRIDAGDLVVEVV